MKTFSRRGRFGNLKYNILDSFKSNRKTTFFLIIFLLLGLLTGIFTAIRYAKGASLISFNDFSLSQYLSGDLGTSDLFFNRLFSNTLVISIICVCSNSVFLLPINLIILTYRSYLVALNCSLIIIVNGFSGVICCLLIILPCQLISLLIITIFASYSFKRAVLKKKYGSSCKIWDKYLIAFFCLLVVNGLETLLLYLFSSQIILVL